MCPCVFSQRWASTTWASSITRQSSTRRPAPRCWSACVRWTTAKRSTRRTCAGCRSRRLRCAAAPRRRHPPSTCRSRRRTGRGRCWTARTIWLFTDIWAVRCCRVACTSGCCSWGAAETPSVYLCLDISPTFYRTSKYATIQTLPGTAPSLQSSLFTVKLV